MAKQTERNIAAQPKPAVVADNLLVLLQERSINLRQLFLRAHRGLNELIAKKLVERGYADVRPVHVALLGNMALSETSFRELAIRSQGTVDGIVAIAEELRNQGFLHIDCWDLKEENVNASFTDAGWELMLTCFNILREIEAEYEKRLQKGDIEHLRRILGTLFD